MLKIIWILLLVPFSAARAAEPKVIHVLVALCDNDYQGIVKVPKNIGNGDDPASNLYWGCAGGVKAEFRNNPEWKLFKTVQKPKLPILERVVFHHISGALLVADAYRGRNIKNALDDFFALLAGRTTENEREALPQLNREIHAGSKASLVVYLGHNGLMDIKFKSLPAGRSTKEAIVLCCESQNYFESILTGYGVKPVLLTRQLMYPGAMVLDAALKGWIKGESREQIRIRAGTAYAHNQKIGVKAGIGIFSIN